MNGSPGRTSNIVSIPRWQISVPAALTSSPPLYPNEVSTSCLPCLTSRSQTALSPTEAILTSSAKPFRTWKVSGSD